MQINVTYWPEAQKDRAEPGGSLLPDWVHSFKVVDPFSPRSKNRENLFLAFEQAAFPGFMLGASSL